ncbi:MAG: serine hydrolase [Paracoccaceae bacterium]|nr:serine hydrolase [Paracoccaceae bacterium]MDG1369992.1 serine hydrolase [Paracoccaceae bacterium]
MSTIMQGFPPAEADQATLANWRSRPHSAWALNHVREIVPSAEIPNDPDNRWVIEVGAPAFDISSIEPAMDTTDADAVVVMHQGKRVFERYRNGNDASTPHILFSVSKSMLGLLAGSLAASGDLKLDGLITDYIPELITTIYNGATVRDALDMRVGVSFVEDYLATEGPIVDYRYAANWNPVPVGREAGDLRSFMRKLVEADGEHGQRFHYVSPNTDLLAWVFERATGQRYADLFADRIWKPLGAANSGYITVDRIGGARAAGGMCLTARDLALVGQMLVLGGTRNDVQILPESWIEDIETKGDADAWATGDFADKMPANMNYRSKWYVHPGDKPLIHGLGIHGQYVFVDRARELSVSWFSSGHDPLGETQTADVLKTIFTLREAIDEATS